MTAPKPKPGLANRIGRPLLAGAIVAAAAAPAVAPADTFLQLDKIPGEAADAKHKDWIEILSYTQSYRQTISSGGGGGGAGKVTCGDITVLKNIDKSSPELLKAITSGTHIAKGVIEFVTASGKASQAYYKVTLSDILISQLDQTDQPDPARIVERVSLNAAKYEYEYRVQKEDGSLEPAIKFGFDCKASQKI